MHGSESGGGKVFGRFAEPAHRVLDLAREEAERCGHRYLGPEHVLLGTLVEGQSRPPSCCGPTGWRSRRPAPRSLV